jgi:hypothetical protein
LNDRRTTTIDINSFNYHKGVLNLPDMLNMTKMLHVLVSNGRADGLADESM